MDLQPSYLDAIKNTSLFYPCCGSDLEVPLKRFAGVISNYYFVDIKMPRLPRLQELKITERSQETGVNCMVHMPSGHEFRVHCWERRAEDVIEEIPNLGIFFFRGDNPVNGEGSSGILWLGGELFSRILRRLISGGLVVTDGSNPGLGGPIHLSDFYHDRKIGDGALSKAVAFKYQGRDFTCVDYIGERNGPTLVWQSV